MRGFCGGIDPRSVGAKKVQRGTVKAVSEARKVFSSLFLTEKLSWGEKETVLTTVRSLEDVASLLQDGRQVIEPHYSIGVDFGQDELLAVLQQYETAPDQEDDEVKDGGTNRAIIIAAIDQVKALLVL